MAAEAKVPLTRVDAVEIGRMYLFEYDPKYKDVLPYYDRFPLVIPIEMRFGGFLGLNLHYLPTSRRVNLFEAIDKTLVTDTVYDDETRLNVSYESILVFAGLFSGYEQCLKHYLYGHVRSSFGLIKPSNWGLAVGAPLERWAARGVKPKRKRKP
jgi:hypothetical protein